NHVFLGENAEGSVIGAATIFLDYDLGYFRMLQPGFYRGHTFQLGRVQHGFHRAAIGMTTDDDVLDAQRYYRIFDGGGDATHHLAVGGDDVADVAGDEQITGRTLGNQFGHYT